LPFPAGGRLALCSRCGAAQSLPDERWFHDIRSIYENYKIYDQAAGAEQYVFDAASCMMRSRSAVLLDRLLAVPGMPTSGTILDVGCGTGGTLKAFAGRGNWILDALDLDKRNVALFETLPGFRTFYTCPPAQVPEQYDVITLVHSLEHFLDPLSTLQDLRGKLRLGGRLFVEVPDAAVNPFEYVIADHRTHFTPETLEYLLKRGGFSVQFLGGDWVAKEISLVATQGTSSEVSLAVSSPDLLAQIVKQLKWLSDFGVAARTSATCEGPFGLFGTAIAAMWLWPAVSQRVEFFVEEDPNRVGHKCMDRPILNPAQIPSGAVVFLALVPAVAARIQARLAHLPVDFRMPPPTP
jgi:SAM-dependent methyltransferase